MSMEQEDQGFEQGFASVMGPDNEHSAPAADAADAAGAGDAGEQGAAQSNDQGSEASPGEEGTQPADVAGAAAAGDEGATQTTGAAEGAAAGGEGQASAVGAPDPADSEIVLDGLTRAELRNLLGKAAEVEGLKDGLRKAHGKIGEMNDRLRKAPASAAATSFGGVSFSGLEGEAFDQAVSQVVAQAKIDSAAFGDFSEESITRGIVTTMLRLQQLQQLPQAQQAPAQPDGQGATLPMEMPQSTPDDGASVLDQPATQVATQQPNPSNTQIQVEQRVLDRVRPGWRETVDGEEFKLWLGAQNQEFQQSYLQADTAETFAGVLDSFGQWKTARDTAVSKSAKAQARLEQSLTPTGKAPKPQTAMTEDEEFEAAFTAITKQRL